jgi:hypothetical protein
MTDVIARPEHLILRGRNSGFGPGWSAPGSFELYAFIRKSGQGGRRGWKFLADAGATFLGTRSQLCYCFIDLSVVIQGWYPKRNSGYAACKSSAKCGRKGFLALGCCAFVEALRFWMAGFGAHAG